MTTRAQIRELCTMIESLLQKELAKVDQNTRPPDPEPSDKAMYTDPKCPSCRRDMTGQSWYNEGGQIKGRAVCAECAYTPIITKGTWTDEYKTLKADARRYQYLKTAERGALYWSDGWLDVGNKERWNEMIDKAMEKN